jgi:predicted ATPase
VQTEDGSQPIGGGTVSQLQSQEQAGLLDAIDQLRRENIDADIGIPQIVVCGDQSSGKSSLLEAIAQVPFPAGSGAVTMCKCGEDDPE